MKVISARQFNISSCRNEYSCSLKLIRENRIVCPYAGWHKEELDSDYLAANSYNNNNN